MKNQRLTVKRRPVRTGGVTTLFANVARKKKVRQRAATAAPSAGTDGDVPNLGITRALVAILAIHVLAIGGIVFHSRWLEGETPETFKTAAREPAEAAPPRPPGETGRPTTRSGQSLYAAVDGDSYQAIARRFGVDEMTLRQVNDNLPVRDGRYLRIPAKTPPAGEAATAGRQARTTPAAAEIPRALPVGDLVETEAARRADAREAGPSTQPGSYKVQRGDTFWGIAQRFGTSADRLMALNGIEDPKRLRVGMVLKLP